MARICQRAERGVDLGQLGDLPLATPCGLALGWSAFLSSSAQPRHHGWGYGHWTSDAGTLALCPLASAGGKHLMHDRSHPVTASSQTELALTACAGEHPHERAVATQPVMGEGRSAAMITSALACIS
jgi:hypothetical protein